LAWFGANFSCVLYGFFMCVLTFPCSESSLILEQRFDQFAEAASSACWQVAGTEQCGYVTSQLAASFSTCSPDVEDAPQHEVFWKCAGL
jgi:hypothetical protein